MKSFLHIVLKYQFNLLLLLSAFSVNAQQVKQLDVEAHAGGRGLYPGNSIPAFINAIKLGVNTLEMDCMISKDSLVFISHDPFMNATFMLTPSGQAMDKEKQEDYNLFEMPYDSIRQYQLGMKYDPEFPKQKRIKTYKPLLSEVIDSVETYVRKHHLKPVQYNIEIKSYRDAEHFNPDPETFSKLVMGVLKKHKMEDRVYIQSFDIRPLQYIHKHYPSYKLSFLISKNNTQTLQQNLDQLGFTPAVYSPEYPMVDASLMKGIRQNHMAIIPWTVDKEEDWRKLIHLGVDGIITNYPDQLIKFLSQKGEGETGN